MAGGPSTGQMKEVTQWGLGEKRRFSDSDTMTMVIYIPAVVSPLVIWYLDTGKHVSYNSLLNEPTRLRYFFKKNKKPIRTSAFGQYNKA